MCAEGLWGVGWGRVERGGGGRRDFCNRVNSKKKIIYRHFREKKVLASCLKQMI